MSSAKLVGDDTILQQICGNIVKIGCGELSKLQNIL